MSSCDSNDDKGILLRLSPETGTVLESIVEMDISMKGAMDMSTTMDIEFKMEVDDVDKEGIISLTYEYTRIKMNMEMKGQKIDYDSDDTNPSDRVSQQMSKAMAGMMNTPFSMKMNGRSKIVEAPDFSEIFRDNPMMARQADQIKQAMDNMFAIYPEETIKSGDSWKRNTNIGNAQMPMTLDATYTVKDILDNLIVLELDGILNDEGGMADIEGTFNGTIDIDRATGFPIKCDLKQKISMSMQGQEMDMIMDMTIDAKVTQ